MSKVPNKRRQTKAGRPRAQRYSGAALRRATLAECERRVNKWAGPKFWSEQRREYLNAVCDGGTEACVLLAQIKAVIEQRPTLRKRLEKYVQTMPQPPTTRARAVLMELHRAAIPKRTPVLSRRAVLVIEFGEPGHMWWPDRAPTDTELAVLSILAGNLGDEDRTLTTTGEVIRQEAKRIAEARRSWPVGPVDAPKNQP